VALPQSDYRPGLGKCVLRPIALTNEVPCLAFQIIRDETVRPVEALTTGMEPFAGSGTPDNEHIPQLRMCECWLDLQQVAIVRFREQQTSFIEALAGDRFQLITPGKSGTMEELIMSEGSFHAA